MELESYIRHIPGFPKEGILFHDITPLLLDGDALRHSVDRLGDFAKECDTELVIGAEARGFLVGAALAYALGVGFAAARKPGKLPWTVSRSEYELEYGTDALEMHADAIRPGQRVLIHDDLLATGGTAAAAASLITKVNAHLVGYDFLVELAFLEGRHYLPTGVPVHSMVRYT